MSTKKIKTDKESSGPLIYLGPNLPGGRLMRSTVFRNEIPAYLEKLIDEQPAIAELIVPVKEMAALQANIAMKGSAPHTAYQNLQGGLTNGI